MTHVELISTITRLVRDAGAAGALDELRATRPTFDHAAADHATADRDGYHDTLAVFAVWAVNRLVSAGLSDVAVLWHPLTDPRSAWSWYDAGTLASDAARTGFVPSTLAGAADPAPAEPRVLLAA